MAQITIRPAIDISSSNVTYSSGSSIYPLINETTADGDTTYAGWILGAVGEFIVKCNSIDTSKIQTINSITAYFVYRGGGVGSTIFYEIVTPSQSSASANTGTNTSYVTASRTINVNLPPSSFDLSNVQLRFGVSSAGTKDNTYVTQMYVVIDYTEKLETLYVKIGSSWHKATALYVKIGSSWHLFVLIYNKIGSTWHSG